MNRKTLQKVIDAIKNEKLEYAMGVLDTLMESLPEEKVVWNPEKEQLVVSNHLKGELNISEPKQDMDEGAMLDMIAKTAISKMPPIQTE